MCLSGSTQITWYLAEIQILPDFQDREIGSSVIRSVMREMLHLAHETLTLRRSLTRWDVANRQERTRPHDTQWWRLAPDVWPPLANPQLPFLEMSLRVWKRSAVSRFARFTRRLTKDIEE